MITVHRPWGNFQQFTYNEESTVKIITINPGQRLSLQSHEHRDEHWFILDGPVDVTLGKDTMTLPAGTDVFVSRMQHHRLGNSQDHPVRVLEIATGEFDEDDICRFEDEYGRA